MRNRHLYALFIWLQFICPTLSAQHKLYVSSSGNDANAGTIASPLKTPAAAIEKINRSKQSHIAILFRQGTYHLDETLSLDNNSLQGKTVSLAAYKNENVTFSAGRKLSLKWEKHTGNIWKSRIENAGFESLFINGIPQILARYPNYDSTARVFNGTAEDAISSEKIAKWKTILPPEMLPPNLNTFKPSPTFICAFAITDRGNPLF